MLDGSEPLSSEIFSLCDNSRVLVVEVVNTFEKEPFVLPLKVFRNRFALEGQFVHFLNVVYQFCDVQSEMISWPSTSGNIQTDQQHFAPISNKA